MYAQKSKFCFWTRKRRMPWGFSVLLSFFSPLIFLLFSSFCCSCWPFFWACFQFHQVISPISEHFRAYFFRFKWRNHWVSSERSWVWKWCQFWSKVITSRKKELRPTLITDGDGWHWHQRVKVSTITTLLHNYYWSYSPLEYVRKNYKYILVNKINGCNNDDDILHV